MLLMYAIEQERDKEHNRKAGTKTQEQIAKERIGSLKALLGDDSPETVQGMITIEVTPEDMRKAKKERESRAKQIKERRLGGNALPSGAKLRPSSRK